LNRQVPDIGEVIAQLRAVNESVPFPLALPTAEEVAGAERELRWTFPADYRRFLLEASDVVVGSLEHCLVTPDAGYRDLVTTAREAWDLGMSRDLLPICEDNGDYYCLDSTGRVHFWSHNGVTDETWPDLATWIRAVWIGESGDQ
jgi:hypothetical protein